jgi:formylglycine-generating enzyme required for sulfatase activity
LNSEANGFRLPTEAEWEYACRCFSQTIYCYGNDPERFKYYGLGSEYTSLPSAPVRSRLPNAFGLFDMHGNVWEWCHDWYSDLTNQPLVDPFGPDQPIAGNDLVRVYRGGGVGTFSGRIDSESRGQGPPNVKYDNLGFRVVLPVSGKGS